MGLGFEVELYFCTHYHIDSHLVHRDGTGNYEREVTEYERMGMARVFAKRRGLWWWDWVMACEIG